MDEVDMAQQIQADDIKAALASRPVISVLALLNLAPWLVLILISYSHNKRFETVVKMYENNVQLVNKALHLCNSLQKINKINLKNML